jgi:protein required for attachment to host cells
MQIPANTHVAVVDGERFLLMRNTGTVSEPTLQVESQPDVATNNKNAGMRHMDDLDTVDDGTSSADPLDKQAHAAGVADWLNREVEQRRIAKLVIAADPATLGELRRGLSKQTEAAVIGELDKELTGMPTPQILKVIEAA